jgi:hypothetical protein
MKFMALALFTLALALTLPRSSGAGDQAVTAELTLSHGPPVRGLRLTLSANQDEYSEDTPVHLVVTLENVGGEPAELVNAAHADLYKFDIQVPKVVISMKDDLSDRAPLTLRGQAGAVAAQRGGRGNKVTVLRPGQSVGLEVQSLNRLYDMTLAGTYRIVVRRELKMPASGKQVAITLESNPIEFRIGKKAEVKK